MSCMAHQLAVSRRFLDYEDVDLIRELVAMLPKDKKVVVADLGAGSGTTALSVFAERDSEITVITIDHSVDALHWAGLAVANSGYEDNWVAIHSDSIAVQFDNPSHYDMLMIDTSHEYEETVKELDLWLLLLESGAPVWLHDYRGGYPGVTKAVDEFVAAGKLRQHAVRGLGWGGFKA